MAPRIVVIGGGSYQWVPKLLVDLANTPSLADAEIVLRRHRPRAAAAMADFVGTSTIAKARAIPLSVSDHRPTSATRSTAPTTWSSRISTGGFASMRHDLEIPDGTASSSPSATPSGPAASCARCATSPCSSASRATWRSRLPGRVDAQHHEPDDHALPRGDARDRRSRPSACATRSRSAQFLLSLLLDADFRDFDLDGRPASTTSRSSPHDASAGDDGFARLRELLADPDARGDEPVHMPPGLGHEQHSFGGSCRKRDLLAANRVKFELFERFGVLPARGRSSPRRVLPRASSPRSRSGAGGGACTSPRSRTVSAGRTTTRTSSPKLTRRAEMFPTCRRARSSRR